MDLSQHKTQIHGINEFIQKAFNDLCMQYPHEDDEGQDLSYDELESIIMKLIYEKAKLLASPIDMDKMINEKLFNFGFVTPEHLELKPELICQSDLQLIQTQLLRVSTLRSPKEKLSCIINVCKLVSGVVKQNGFVGGEGPGADDFLPALIYVVLKIKPQDQPSSIRYIREFRDPTRITGLIDYYLTAYESVFDFIETLSADKLKISKEEYNAYLQKNDFSPLAVNTAKFDPEVRLSETDIEAMRALLIHNFRDSLKFEKSSYKSLFATDVKDLHTEYQFLVSKYAQLSDLMKKYVI